MGFVKKDRPTHGEQLEIYAFVMPSITPLQGKNGRGPYIGFGVRTVETSNVTQGRGTCPNHEIEPFRHRKVTNHMI